MEENEQGIHLWTRELYDRMYAEASYVDNFITLDSDEISRLSPVELDAIRRERQDRVMTAQVDEGYEHLLWNLWRIEEFVLKVLSSNKPAFRLIEGHFGRTIVKREEPLAAYFLQIYRFIDYLDEGYAFSPRVELFVECWLRLRLNGMFFDDPARLVTSRGMRQFEIFNDFLSQIRTEARTEHFRRKVSRAREKVARRCRRAKRLVDALFDRVSSRLLVLRIDFGYRKAIANTITAALATEHLGHFLNNKRGNPTLFHGWLSYIRKLEYTPQKGLHFHLIIFFDGIQRHKDASLAQQLGEYWEKTTEGQGSFWNCNDEKNRYKRRDIGMIEHDDQQKRQILQEHVIAYLAKTDQQLRSFKLSSNREDDGASDDAHRLFVMGQLPRKGRKRLANGHVLVL